jgi:hypothetical protein
MTIRNLGPILVIASYLVLAGCAASKQGKQMSADANAAFAGGDYAKALQSYEDIIAQSKSKGKEVEGAVYHNAGVAAWELGQVDKAIEYLGNAIRAKGAVPRTYSILAKAYLKIDNLSKEINYLEDYIALYPLGEEIYPVRSQLFNAYVRSENWDLGYNLWPTLSNKDRADVAYLTGYLRVNRKLNKVEERDKLAQELLKMDKNNVEALEVLADKYYRLADDSYVTEMKAYEKNRTNKQYKQLTEAFKKVNENFKISRDYYERLYKVKPDPSYANYLGNIYTRFENKEKANYWYKQAKKK